MSGREASSPDDPRIAPMGGERAGPVGVQRSGRPVGLRKRTAVEVVVEALCRIGRAIRKAVQAAVGWCVGRPRRDARIAVPPRPAALAADVLPTYQAATGPADARLIAREVRRLLGGLGRTPGDVAASLYALGAAGVPHDATRAPVGVYLSAVVGADPAVAAVVVRSDAVCLYLRGHAAPTMVSFPGPIRDFGIAFNSRCYPLLVGSTHDQGPTTEV